MVNCEWVIVKVIGYRIYTALTVNYFNMSYQKLWQMIWSHKNWLFLTICFFLNLLVAAEYSSSYTSKWSGLLARGYMGGCSNVLLVVHCLCYNCGTKEGGQWFRPYSYWICSGGQHLSRWSFLWGFNEPSSILWSCFGELGLDWSLGLLGWATYWWWACRFYLWKFLHHQISCPDSHWGRRLLIVHSVVLSTKNFYLAVFPVMLPVDSFSQLYLNLSIFLSHLVFIVVNLVELLILKAKQHC